MFKTLKIERYFNQRLIKCVVISICSSLRHFRAKYSDIYRNC